MKLLSASLLLTGLALSPMLSPRILAQPDALANLPNMTTPVKDENIDASAFAEWHNGVERKILGDEANAAISPATVLWSDKNTSRMGMPFGDNNTAGVRHLRIGFKTPIPVGSVLVHGGGSLSVLKPDAAYPGDMGNESKWVPAQRLDNGLPSRNGVQEYALWTLPPNTTTRALRFSHMPQLTDKSFTGRLGGVFVMSERFTNVAPQSTVITSHNTRQAQRLINGEYDNWSAWNNEGKPDSPVISNENPAWVMLFWPSPVRLSGLATLWSGIGATDVQVYSGAADTHPRDAAEADWTTVRSFAGIENGYPYPLYPSRLDFGQTVATRAVRLRVKSAANANREQIARRTLGGRHIWLGEVMALAPLENNPLAAVSFPASEGKPHPPIPVRFTLAKSGYVSLVIEDKSGKRIRNLVSETFFAAGENTAWWDGTDDLGRDVDAAQHGLYKIPARFVTLGDYRVRGLVRDAIVPRYEFSVYTPGSPPWKTLDTTGAWTTNHSPPQAALFLPASKAPGGKGLVYLGSYVSEGGSGLAWVDEDGRKQGGRGWIGGNWTAAPFLASDTGAQAMPGIYAYVGSVWTTGKTPIKMELRLTGLSQSGDKAILRHVYETINTKADHEIGGLAVRDGILVVSLPLQKQLLFADAKAGKVIGTAALDEPRGLVFDAKGALLALSGTKLVRFAKTQLPLAAPETIVATGLEAPSGITLDAAGNIYISDRGQSHQVKVFDSNGKFLRVIGKAGSPKAGPYDELRMNNPMGMAIDSKNQLWVTEADFLPKRVSVWTLEGKLLRAYYGPGKYGGGGMLDPQDKTRFYYADEHKGSMEFKLDWEKGESKLVNVLYRRLTSNFTMPTRAAAPEYAIYLNGKRYFTNCYNSSPFAGSNTALLFMEKDGILRPAAAFGSATDWELLGGEAFKARWPMEYDPASKKVRNRMVFAWSDTSGDGQVQPAETTFQMGNASGITVMEDLSFVAAQVGDKAMRFAPSGFSAQGIPNYDLSKGQVLAEGVQGPASSGGTQALTTPDGYTAITLGIKPYSDLSVSGAKNGVPDWSYPSLWPGLHASHRAPQPTMPGQLIGTTRLLGGWIVPKGSEVGPLWAVNSNMGPVYLFTADGLFVATVFKDSRQGQTWTMPVAQRNMDLSELTLNDENFWPSISQSPDGEIYMVDGARLALVRLDGLDTLRRLPATDLKIGADDLQKSQAYIVAAEARRQQEQGSGILEVAMRAQAPKVDGDLADWKNASWVDIDRSGVGASFNSESKPYDVTGAVAVSGERLYAAWKTGDDKLLRNTGELATAPFKTGGALDLMIATDPKADPKRSAPVAGDLRLLITEAKGKTMAVLYRAVVAGTTTPVPFSSPWRTITLDKVEDVSAHVQLAKKGGDYEVSIPLEVLGLKPQAGQPVQGDMGVLRGDGTQTTARVYWSNKATGITADVPSEAQLMPQLWGKIEFKAAP